MNFTVSQYFYLVRMIRITMHKYQLLESIIYVQPILYRMFHQMSLHVHFQN